MRFQNEVYDKYLTYSSLGNRIAAKLSMYGKMTGLLELCDIIGTDKVEDENSLGVMEIPVDKIVGSAGVLGNESYTADFIPVEKPNSSFAESWRGIYLDYLNEKTMMPISCYEYLGKFYIIDGKKRVSVMKCNGVSNISANVTRILPNVEKTDESCQYYSFLECFQRTGLHQVCLHPQFSFYKLQNAMGFEKDYQWSAQDRSNLIFHLFTVKSALQLSKLRNLPLEPIDALMVLLESYSYADAIKMNSRQMAKAFNENKEKLYALCPKDAKKLQKIA